MIKNLVALVLAGGEGKRFWPLQSDKSLFPFCGQPLIYRTILTTIPQEAKLIVFIANHKNRSRLEKLTCPVPHKVIVQQHPNGMADAILTAKDEIKGVSLLLYIADHLVDQTLTDTVLKKARETNSFAVIPGWMTPTYFPGGYLEMNGDRVVGIKEKPGAGKEPSKYVNVTGHYISDADLLLAELLKTSSDADDRYEKSLTQLAGKYPITIVPYTGISVSLKYPWNVLSVMTDLLLTVKRHTGTNVTIKPNVIIEGEVFLGDNVKIFENTKISGPCYIGDNTIIGNNNIIRGSHIGKNCVTGFNTDITRSYIGDSCWFHSNYIGDSVLEGNISLGSGAVLANLRLDEENIKSSVQTQPVDTGVPKLGAIIGQNVRIGVNVSVMPGVKIGSGTFISSGLVVNQDIPENSFVEVKQTLSIRSNRTPESSGSREEFRQQLK
jgi:NDP-sugar pyrophosphorylase family protein